jgi:hypothetical protein
MFRKLKEAQARVERLENELKSIYAEKAEPKLNLCTANAFELARFITNHKLLSVFKGMQISSSKGEDLEEIGLVFAEKLLYSLIELETPIGGLMDKILGVENSLNRLQIGEILALFNDDTQVKEIKAFFKLAFKQENQ